MRRPVVIFPEATKTNGRGILNFEQDILDIILKAAYNKDVKLHTIRFDYDFVYNSPYNTVDPFGLKTAIATMA